MFRVWAVSFKKIVDDPVILRLNDLIQLNAWFYRYMAKITNKKNVILEFLFTICGHFFFCSSEALRFCSSSVFYRGLRSVVCGRLFLFLVS